MLHGLDHVVVAVGDLEAATLLTGQLLGRRPSWRGVHPGAGSENALFRVENTYLELLAPAGEGPIGAALRRRLDAAGEGLVALAFGADDVARCAARWREQGLSVEDPAEGEGRDAKSGAVRRWCSVAVPPAASRGPLLFAIEHHSPTLPLRAPECEADAAVAALDHVVVLSPDIEASQRLYAASLGLRLALDRSFEQRGVRLLFFRVGGVTLEIAGRLGAEPRPEEPDRFGGLAWRVADADAARARLAKAGVDVSELRSGHKPGTRVFTVRSPTCGVPTLFIGPSRPVAC